MKKKIRFLVALGLTLSVLIGVNGCGKSTVETAAQTEPVQSHTEKQIEGSICPISLVAQ